MKKFINFETKFIVQVPMTPNFIKVFMSDEDREGESRSIHSFSNEQLKIIGKEWTDELIERAQELRKYK